MTTSAGVTSEFSPDYVTARANFRKMAERLQWQHETHSIGQTGPDGQNLTIDVVLSPGDDARPTLVLSSGLHGVEGPFGSAVQCDALLSWERSAPPVRVVLIHALNPYGFAWRRRANENNVDLNRNFLLPDERYEGSPPGYTDLDGFLNPKSAPSPWEPFTLKALWLIAREGLPKLRQAIAGGQYDFPQGVFFGGIGPERVPQILGEHLPRWLGASRAVVHLDFHTGLGAGGTGKLLIDYPLSESDRRRLIDWYGPQGFEASDSRTIAYDSWGSLGRWCRATNPERDYLYACAEFGTFGPVAVLGGLRAENRAHHWSKSSSATVERTKQRLAELFCPSSPRWRQQVLEGARMLIAQSIAGLRSVAPAR
ncbi:DUF2817 domain-containing protein [Planctomyces sp. SH-PL14]|uniref:DUF2817 domain-containing protein n=1 Tax=Planctomyces sp. SH-PL14 TaxID=1632864 RepID=UPI00078E8449|nr:DUF2817 domain-containing protein [Planctomyces sp. SH-PL14]AMV19720.1 murein peptide amidase A [Planctomyces sp. SH-PL14]